MDRSQIAFDFCFGDLHSNRRKLFQHALQHAQIGRVLYIMCNELEELPQLSQELDPTNRQYMKVISFLYAKSLPSLIEALATLPEWQNIPKTIILDDITSYCSGNNLQTACGVVTLLIDSVRSCSLALQETCSLFISVTKGNVDENYCNVLKDLYVNS